MNEPRSRNGEYIEAGGVNTYFEVTGDGDPLVLLHGGFCPAETFDGLTPGLAEAYRVFVPERRGHGRTADVEGPITYEIMAKDTIAFLDAVEVGNAHLVGWSDGAAVAVHVVLERPDLVRSLVLIVQPLNHDGLPDQAKEMVDSGITPDALPPMLRELYSSLSPDGPEHFDVVFEKLTATWATEPSFEVADLARISAPTLFMMADADMVTLEHARDVEQALPDARLEVVPDASHGLPMEKPEVVTGLIRDFLSERR
jgi:pimeloyl-ACP methyl ester carboxylesterase